VEIKQLATRNPLQFRRKCSHHPELAIRIEVFRKGITEALYYVLTLR
jgi:hypothetical protein